MPMVSVRGVSRARSVVAEGGLAVQRVPVESLDDDGLRDLVRAVGSLQGDLDRLLVRVGLRAEELALAGASGGAGEVLLDRGQVSGRRARAERSRVEVAGRLPLVGEAVTEGRLTGEQLDSLARRCTPLTDEQLSQLDVEGLVAEAEAMPADTFDAVVKRAVDAVVADGRAAEAREASEVRHWLDRRTGMGHPSTPSSTPSATRR